MYSPPNQMIYFQCNKTSHCIFLSARPCKEKSQGQKEGQGLKILQKKPIL